MSITREKILELGENLIRTKGYNAFSYQDISSKLGIKNAAVHYYFPTKSPPAYAGGLLSLINNYFFSSTTSPSSAPLVASDLADVSVPPLAGSSLSLDFADSEEAL